MRVILINVGAAKKGVYASTEQKGVLEGDVEGGKAKFQTQKTPVFRPGPLLSTRSKPAAFLRSFEAFSGP
jgi:hypothetical protein